ncbi:MAG: hypothetical protein IPP19_06360 [Verrucomicrobia bacterium]|nr:hypothetical protein [Verrucomicrobiota bacterium]
MLNWASGNPGVDRLQSLIKLGYQQEPWKSRYPECAAIPNDWSVITAPGSRWLTPEGSVFSGNIGWKNSLWIEGLSHVQTYFSEFTDNLEDQDPLFTDEANLNLLLKPNSPAFLVPGFKDIPFDEIGIRP